MNSYKEHDFINGYAVSGIRRDGYGRLGVVVNGDFITLATNSWDNPVKPDKLRKLAELERRKLIFILKGGKPISMKSNLITKIMRLFK